MEPIKLSIQTAVTELFNVDIEPELSRTDEQFGDFSTNVAMKLAKQIGKNPREVADAIVQKLQGGKDVAKVAVAGPGFINFTLSDAVLAAVLKQLSDKPEQFGSNQLYTGKAVVIEHTDPNPFKEFHVGHAYSNTIGESLGRLYKAAGASVHQVSYHGDVGLHIAKAIYGLRHLQTERRSPLEKIPEHERVQVLGIAYAYGAKAYDGDDAAKNDITAINKQVYELTDPEITALYKTGRQWSFDYFDSIYKLLGVSFEKQYFEQDTGKAGTDIVRKHMDVFEESDGAVIFRGETVGLHTRVFITRAGLPTYEAKELGLAFAKQADYHFDEAVVVTANEIDEYFKVLLAALKAIDADLAGKIKHVSHGMVKLPSGKMSSRTGDVVTAVQVVDLLREAIKKNVKGETPALEDNVLGALKYAFLKHRVGGDLVFDIGESISLEGNSGPYLQYAYARAKSVLSKASKPAVAAAAFELGERSLVRKIAEFPEVVDKAVRELMPSHICTYLYELSQVFNRFYEHNRVVNDPREAERLTMVQAYAATLKKRVGAAQYSSARADVMTAPEVLKALKAEADADKAAFFPRFFKAGPGQYGEGDKFLGVTVPKQRLIARQFAALPLKEAEKLLQSPWHECRLTALFILTTQFKKGNDSARHEIYDFYLANTKYVNNWDLVDSSAHLIVGPWLDGKPEKMDVLHRLAESDLLWDRRIAMIGAGYFIRKGSAAEVFDIAERLLHDKHDLIHKAVGWMLREVGKQIDRQLLLDFLDTHAALMPRTALRYAIEHLPPEQRRSILAMK